MTKLVLTISFICSVLYASAQPPKTELYEFVKKLVTDSTGNENVGDWAVGEPKKFPVKWKADNIEVSQDTAINFYRLGTADITINGRSFDQMGQPVEWNVMLKGARSGYSSFSVISTPSEDMRPRYAIDSVFGKRPFKAKLLKSCDEKDLSGYYYYEVKLPKKDVAYLRLGWLSVNGKTAIRVDCFDSYSSYAAKLDCPK
jgi:hypothetical protein